MTSMKPFAYSPNEFDDWGMIRSSNGNIVLRISSGGSDGISFSEHREKGTDPYRDFGEKVVKALNESEIL